jgi:GH25 family lysozyme M1 (1,4-beta-N-acetylmuramidase)
MSEQIVLLDISHWQGSGPTYINWDQVVAAGVRGVIVKVSQGIDSADHCFLENATDARAHGLKVGAYHYCTPHKAATQYEWMLRCIGNFQLDFPLALDVEGVHPLGNDTISSADLWVLCGKLKGYQGYDRPWIYTNWSTGNVVCPYPAYKSMAEYPLWIASWRPDTPLLPNTWAKQGGKYVLWQIGKQPGNIYGILQSESVDVNWWGNLSPFPGDPTPPPPPPPPVEPEVKASISVVVNGVTWSAKNVPLTKGA